MCRAVINYVKNWEGILNFFSYFLSIFFFFLITDFFNLARFKRLIDFSLTQVLEWKNYSLEVSLL